MRSMLKITEILALCLIWASTNVVDAITITPLLDQRVYQGDEVVIDCAIQNIPSSNFLFFIYHDGEAVAVGESLARPNPDGNYQLDTSVYGHWKLRIVQAQIEDQGKWECKVQIPRVIVQDMFLEVLASPVITSMTADMMPTLGSTVYLWCNATGSPDPSVTWTRQRPFGTLPTGVDYITGNPLVINSIGRSWRGLYQCFVTNGIGDTVTAAVFLQMEYSPMVKAVQDRVTVQMGERAYLRCKGEAYPAVTSVDRVIWRRNDRLVMPSDGYQMSVELETDIDPYKETSVATLIVNTVDKDNTGEYSCRFENILGGDERRIRLEAVKAVAQDTGDSSSSSVILGDLATSVTFITIATVLMRL